MAKKAKAHWSGSSWGTVEKSWEAAGFQMIVVPQGGVPEAATSSSLGFTRGAVLTLKVVDFFHSVTFIFFTLVTFSLIS